MYKKDKNFKPIAGTRTLWRYLDLAKYVSLISQKHLFFSSASRFEDPFEGVLNNASKDALRKWYAEGKTTKSGGRKKQQQAEKELNAYFRYMDSIKPFTVINSWHINENESFAMWKIYSERNIGVAITTTFKSLTHAFDVAKEDIYIGKVNYIDEERDLVDPANSYHHFMVKRSQFAYERELRCIHQVPQEREHEIEQIYDLYGLRVSIDINTLLQSIYVSPYAEKWVKDVVADLNSKYGIAAEIRQSTLLSSENY
ncbi:MAG: hypothetical protein V4649_08200 [Bacteroidota bacterium]